MTALSKTISVYCGSKMGTSPAFAAAARQLGQSLAGRQVSLMYGGAQVGLMGVLANAVLDAGGRVTGIMPKALEQREIAHGRLTELVLVETMHERKARMIDGASAFVALAGGLGTLDELFEVLTWSSLGLHARPMGLLNTEGYFDALLRFLDEASDKGFIAPAMVARLVVEDDVERLLARIL